jgi:hypothetical protein
LHLSRIGRPTEAAFAQLALSRASSTCPLGLKHGTPPVGIWEDGEWQGPCRAGQQAANRPDEPTAGKRDGSFSQSHPREPGLKTLSKGKPHPTRRRC